MYDIRLNDGKKNLSNFQQRIQYISKNRFIAFEVFFFLSLSLYYFSKLYPSRAMLLFPKLIVDKSPNEFS